MNLASLAVRRPTLVMAVFTVMIVVGAFSYTRLSVDLFPNVDFPILQIMTVYKGAGPEEIEQQVTKPIEDALSGLAGIKHIISTSQDGASIVMVEFQLGTDIKDLQNQAWARVSLARYSMPDAVEQSVIHREDPSAMPIAIIAVRGTLPPADMYDLANEELKPQFEQVHGIGSVMAFGGSRREIQVLLDREKLKKHEIALTTVAGKIAASSSNVPVGKVSEARTDTTFRTIGEYRSLDRLRKLAANFYASDVSVPVSDLGEVVETTEDAKTAVFVDGKPALFLAVFKQSGGNTVSAMDGVVKKIAELNKSIADRPGKLKCLLVMDNAKFIRMNVNDVRDNILLGIILTIIVVYLFLGNARSTFITVISLPDSLIGAFILMYFMGLTINMVTLLALSLAVGLLVDDAIVVRENIWRHLGEGQPPMEAAISGTREVTMAVVATTLTIIAVFLPIAFLGGIMGMFFKSLGYVVVFAMMVSLFDAMTMAPLLSAYMAGKRKEGASNGEEAGWCRRWFLNVCAPFTATARAFEIFQRWMVSTYERVIRLALRHRVTVLVSVVLLIVVSGVVAWFGIKKTFMPSQDVGFFLVTLEAPAGTSLAAMRSDVLKVDAIIRKYKENMHVSGLIGDPAGDTPNKATFFIEMVPYRERRINTTEMKDRIRKDLKKFTHLNPRIGDMMMMGRERPFTMDLAGEDLNDLAKAAGMVRAEFRKIKDLADVDMEYREGKPEHQVILDPDRLRNLGVSTVTAGMELRGMVDGNVAAKYRMHGREYDIRVRLREDQRDLRQGLGKFWVPNMNNQLVRVSDVAKPLDTTGPTKISRRDRTRYIQISGEMAKGGALGGVQKSCKEIMKRLKLPAGVRYEFVGYFEEFVDLFKNFAIAMALATLFMYMILASLYESLVMPLLILVAVPMAMIGALFSLWITGRTLDIFSLIGLVMLLGLVAKNSILLVDFTMQLTRKGMPREQALVRAGRIRLRPILMTTLALIAGMLPLALALSEVGKFRQSMGIAVIGGLISSVALTLVVVPAFYTWFDDFRLWTRKVFRRPPLRVIDRVEAEERGSVEDEMLMGRRASRKR